MTDSGPEERSFEDARAELKAILERLAEDDVPMAEIVERTRRAKALEVALNAYLEEARGELERIESGEDLPEITIRKVANPEPLTESEPAGVAASDKDIPF